MQKMKNSIHVMMTMMAAICLWAMPSCSDDDLTAGGTGGGIEQATANINSNTAALRTLIVAKSEGKAVKSCTQTSASSYQVELDDGTSLSILTHIDALGAQDKPCYTPMVSAIEGDGTYHWCIDGSPITMADGNKLAVSSDVTPEIGVDHNGYWTVRCGGDIRQLGHKAGPGTVKSLFGGIDMSDKRHVTFLLRGETPSLTLDMADGKDNPGMGPTYALRRPISPDHPAWLIHIDVWNTPDPQAIIDLIPQDIRPYVIFNLSLSVSHDETTGRWNRVEYGYETVKSWLRTCAENDVWAMVQPSSGGFCHFPDYSSYEEINSDKSVFKEFYRDFPNFVGFNYCEQFWGFDDKFSVSYGQRLRHWANLMRLSNEYGGYLVISYCGSGEYSSGTTPTAMLKKDPELAAACRQHPENLIVCEKFTSTAGFFDIESATLGTWLSGYAGQYGMRFDVCGWPDDKVWNGDAGYQTQAGAIAMMEHTMLTGQTVYDGPELIWTEDFKEAKEKSTGEGFMKRSWERFPQFENISMDIYRKIIDGTIRIMSRKEVIDRTKLIVINDITPKNQRLDPGYLTPRNLFEGLYRLDNDGNQEKNIIYFKKTGRYPTIPMAVDLADGLANTFKYQIKASAFNGGWDDIRLKQGKFNRIFPQEYTGELYAGRHENGWMVYNPLPGVRTASIPFKYNTCEKMGLAFGKYTAAAIREYADRVDFYLTNYTTKGTQTTDVIEIHGSDKQPTMTYKNRVEGNPCTVSSEWKDGVFTITITHNGAVDLTINCSGNATGRETRFTRANVSQPPTPNANWGKAYTGPRQYETEYFEYKNVKKVYKNAVADGIRNYTALGYVNLGSADNAAIRNTMNIDEAGAYNIQVRYYAPTANVNTVAMYINNRRVAGLNFTRQTGSNATWQTVSVAASLQKGQNRIELKAEEASAGDLYLDNITVEKQ